MKRRMIGWLALVITTLILVVAVIVAANGTLQGYRDTQHTIATHESAIAATYQTQHP